MAVTPDLDTLLRTIVDASCEIMECERATIFLYDAPRDELFSRVAKGEAGIRFPADRGIAGSAAKQRACVNVPDAYADARFNREVDKKTGFTTRNLLSVPMENLEGALIGVMQLLNKREGAFDGTDEEHALALAAQAGVAIDRGRLIEEYAEKQRMSRDLELARGIQMALFPKKNPEIAGWEIAGWNKSADETGGDCFDFFSLADGRMAIFLADATGHGIGSALIIAQARAALRAVLTSTQDLSQVTAAVNRLLATDLSDDRFVTAFIGILDPKAHKLDYISAGQGPLLFVSAAGCDTRGANGLPLAVMEDIEFNRIGTYRFEPGDTLVLLTDGFYESTNRADEQFGEQRVADLVRDGTKSTLTEIINKMHESVLQFVQGLPQGDDLTAVLVRRNG